jgi:hypothetical protein
MVRGTTRTPRLPEVTPAAILPFLADVVSAQGAQDPLVHRRCGQRSGRTV